MKFIAKILNSSKFFYNEPHLRYLTTAWKVSIFGFILVRISPYSVRMQENADQNNSEYEHFLCSEPKL